MAYRLVDVGAFSEAGVQTAEAGGRMARMGDHADDDLFVNALVPFEGNNIAERQHQFELESHHIMQAGLARGQDFVNHLGDVFGSKFIGGKQAVHNGFVLAKPEVVGAGGILRATGAVAVDPEVWGVDQPRLEHRNVNIQQGHFLAQAFAQAHHRELAGRIAPNTHLAHAAGGRSGDDDAAGAARAHVGQHGLGQFHDAEDVDVVEPADLLHAEIFKEAEQSHARKVHHGVDAAGLADDGVDSAIDVGAAGHVHAQGGNLSAQTAAAGLFAQFLL